MALVAAPSPAQTSRQTSPANGYRSFTRSTELDPGPPLGVVTDASGNAYILICSNGAGYVAKVAPDGTLLYKTQFTGKASSLAVGPGGVLWVQGVGRFDAQGTLTPISFWSNYYTPPPPMTTDALGNVYACQWTGTSYGVAKLDPQGKLTTSLALGAQGFACSAIAVDAAGAVYLTGPVYPRNFSSTPGAYYSTGANASVNIGVVKVAPTLDRVVYAAMIGGDQTDTPAALAVNAAGEVWIAGSGWIGPKGFTSFPLTDIGFPLTSTSSVDAFVLKLTADGSSLIYSAGLGSGSALSLAPLPDGSVRALVQFDNYGAAVVTLDSGGRNIVRQQFLPLPPNPRWTNGAVEVGTLALAPGVDGGLRVLLSTVSTRFPVAIADEDQTPLLVDLPATAPSADLSVALVQPWPYTLGALTLRALVTNNGPDDAEAVRILWPTNWGSSFPGQVECVPGGVAVCQGNGVVLIPHLASGAAMSIDFVFGEPAAMPDKWPQPLLGAVALTSDGNTANNFASLVPQIAAGNQLQFQTNYYGFYMYRSDEPGGGAPLIDSVTTADRALSIWAPSPQVMGGNLWYFDSWNDGNTGNPRVFDGSRNIPVSQSILNFRPAQPVGTDPASLDFVVAPGLAAPATSSINLFPIVHAGTWTMKVGAPGASWVSVSQPKPDSFGGYAVLTGSVDPSGLAPGYYTTSVPLTIDAIGVPEATMNVPISLRIAAQAPVLFKGGIVNAASYRGTSFSAGDLISIFGSGLGPRQLVQAPVPQAGAFPTSLAGTQVQFASANSPSQTTPAQLLYVQDGIIGAIVPDCNIYAASAIVTVGLGGAPALTATVPCGTSPNPGLFTFDQSGTGNAAAVNADGSINTPLNPARRGSVVLLYSTGVASCTGFGTNQLVPTLDPVEAGIAGEPALVLYAGSVPGMTCAAQQIDLLIPSDSATGPAVPLSLRFGPKAVSPAQDGLTLAIQ